MPFRRKERAIKKVAQEEEVLLVDCTERGSFLNGTTPGEGEEGGDRPPTKLSDSHAGKIRKKKDIQTALKNGAKAICNGGRHLGSRRTTVLKWG